jgi:Integrase zinc binding domain/Integrase core domain
MDYDYYQQMLRYLNTLEISEFKDITQRKAFLKQSQYYLVQDKILFRKNRVDVREPLRVVKDIELQDILHNLHSNILAGHFGKDGTYNRAKTRYYWPKMYKTISEYVQNCDTCQRQGRPTNKEPLHPIKVGEPFERIGIDIVGPLKVTESGNRYIVVVTEYLTKWVEAKAIPDMKATTIAKFLYNDIICRHGCPKILLSDRGTSFCNELVDSLCQLITIRHRLSSAYHSQTNGLTERFNKTLY